MRLCENTHGGCHHSCLCPSLHGSEIPSGEGAPAADLITASTRLARAADWITPASKTAENNKEYVGIQSPKIVKTGRVCIRMVDLAREVLQLGKAPTSESVPWPPNVKHRSKVSCLWGGCRIVISADPSARTRIAVTILACVPLETTHSGSDIRLFAFVVTF